MYDSYIYNARILTMDAAFRTFEPGAIGIAQTQIKALHPWSETQPLPPAREHVDARGALIMPGLVNGHTHLPMSLYRGLADDLPLQQWLQEHIFPAEAQFSTLDHIAPSVQLACAEMLLGGITTCCDGYFLAEQIAETVSRIGMRAVLAQGVMDLPAPGVPDPRRNIAAARNFVGRWQQRSSLIRPSIFCHSPYTCSAETLQAAHRAAREAGVLFQLHVAETRTEVDRCLAEQGCTPVAYLKRLGLLDADTLLVHAVWTDAADIAMIAASGAAIAHCPESNMKLAAGVAPVPTFLAAGIRVALGTDGCASNNDLDMFKEMDTAAKLHKVKHLDPTVMSAATVLHMATGMGAGAIGLGCTTGELAQGRAADLILIDIHQPHLTPMYQPVSHLVYAASAADVRDVMIDGRWVVRDRQLLTIDLDEVLPAVQRIADQIKGTHQ